MKKTERGLREKNQVYLDCLDRVKTMLSNEEKALVERTKDWVYIGMGKVPLMEWRFSKIYGRFH